MAAIYLSVGDGNTAGALDLLDASKHKLRGDLSMPPPRPGERIRTVTVPLTIRGATADAMWANEQNIQTKLNQARTAAGAIGTSAGVTLGVQPDTTAMVYFDVLDGDLSYERSNTTNRWLFVTLTLICLPFARGTAYDVGPTATLTNGDGAWTLVEDIPGDVPALVRARFTDVSTTSTFINRLRVGTYSLPSLASGDFDPIRDATAVSPGVSVSESNTVGGALARLTVNETWQTVAQFTGATPANRNAGLFDVWARVRDNAILPSPPSGMTATARNAISYVQQSPTTAGTVVSGTGTSLTVTFDRATTSGNLLIAVIGYLQNSAISAPSGWTIASDGVNTAHAAFLTPDPDVRVAILWKIADGSETGITFTGLTSGNRKAAKLREFAGMVAATPVEVVAAPGTGAASPPVFGAVTTTQAYQLAVQAVCVQSSVDFGGVSSWDGGYTGYAMGAGLGAATKTLTSAGSQAATNAPAATNWATTRATFKSTQTTNPNLATGYYQIRVASVSAAGDVSTATDPVTVFAGGGNVIVVSWTEPPEGPPAQYRVYWNRGQGWKYHNTGSTATTYNLSTETGSTTAVPVDADLSNVRARIGLASATTMYTQSPVSIRLANALWELVHLFTGPLPPIPAADASDPQGWVVQVQAQHPSNQREIDVDALYLFRHPDQNASQVVAEYQGLDLATLRRWWIETRRDGRTFGWLTEAGGTTEAGQLSVLGQLYAGPGDCLVYFSAEKRSGVHDVTNTAANLLLTITPRFRLVKGT